MSQARPFGPTGWPLWLKFTAGFLLAVAIPGILIFFVVLASAREISAQSLTTFINENGSRQRALITSAFEQAQQTSDRFVNEASTHTLLTGFLSSDLQAASAADRQAMNDLLAAQLLDMPNPFFDSVRLLDRDGILRAEVTRGAALLTDIIGDDQSASAAFIAIQNALTLEESQATIFRERFGNIPIIEIVQVIPQADAQPAGFMATSVDLGRVIFDQLTFSDESLAAYSYVISRNDLIYSAPDVRTRANRSRINSAAIRAALAGESRSETYSSGANRDLQLTGYFAPLLITGENETPVLALIAEVPADASSTQLNDLLSARLFVVIVAGVALAAVLALVFTQLVTNPLGDIQIALAALARGDFQHPIKGIGRGDEVGMLAATLANTRDQFHNLIDGLERRIETGTRDMIATQDISRFATTQRDPQIMMERVVELIVERFADIYHAQLFLLDADERYAVLRASSGEVGQQLLARGHRLEIGGLSVIGQATESGEVVVARDTRANPIHRRNEYLPETRAELAIPMRIGTQIIGALDVQSKMSETFSQDEIDVLQTMAGQIAIAIENARLFEQSVRRLEEIENSNRAQTRDAWQQHFRTQHESRLSSEAGTPGAAALDELRRQAITQRTVIVGDVTPHATIPVAVPIFLRGQTLGAIELEFPQQEYDNNKLLLAQELAGRLAISLDNARLFQQSQQAAARERLVNTIAAKLSTQTDIDAILQTAVQEVGQALRVPQVSIRFNLDKDTKDDDPNGAGESRQASNIE